MDNFKYQLKILTNEKSMLFWTIIFPIILATLFNLAFSNLNSLDKFNIVKIAVVEETENNEFKTMINELSKENENQLISIQYTDKKAANKLLKDEKISGYLVMNNEIEIVVNDNGIDQTIIKAIVDKYYQVGSIIGNIYQYDYSKTAEEIVKNLNLDKDNFNTIENNSTDASAIYFYTLIGMTCLYGSFWGLKVVTINEANLSKKGARINISPTPKIKNLFIGICISFIVHYISMLILFGYLVFGLGINFGNQTNYILLLMAVGTFVGISVGNLVGNAFKASENSKVSILVAISMFLSFLSGMMSVDIKYIIQENIPIMSYLNPINLITDGLYALYYYTSNDRYFLNLIGLLIIGIIIFSISFILMRRKKYDSI